MNQSKFVKSTLILTVATLISKVLGSIFRIPLQNIAGDEVLGIFSMVYPVYMVALILSVAGIPIAISQLIAKARFEKNGAAIRNIYITASILGLSFGIISFIIIYSFADFLASALGGPETKLALIVVASTLLVAPYMAVYRGFFQGFEDMRPTAISQVIEQFVRVGLILIIAYSLVSKGYPNDIISGGIMSGSIIGSVASLLYLRFTYNKSQFKIESDNSYSFSQFINWSKKILKVSIPIAIGAITMALLNFVDSFTIPYGLRAAGTSVSNVNYIYGIYGRGLALVQIATVFATSIILPLIPNITAKLAEEDFPGTRQIINNVHWMTHLFSWPAAFGLLALTLPLNLAFFTNLEGSAMLAIIGFSSVFTSLTILGTGVLQGMNLAKTGALIIIFGVIFKTFANIYLIQLFGLNGAALATLLIYIALFLINSYFIFKNISYTIINLDTVKMIGSSILMGIIISIPTLYSTLEHWTRIQSLGYSIGAIIVGAIIYFLLLLLFKVIKKGDLKKLPIIGGKSRE